MRKIILLAMVLLMAGTVSAQNYLTSDRDNVTVVREPSSAITAGVSITNTTGGGANFNTNSVAGFNVGFSFDLPVSNNFSIAPGVLYAQKGFTANTQFGNFTQRSQYIDVPVLAMFKVSPQINLYAGPQISYFVAANNTFSANFSQEEQNNYGVTGSNLLLQGFIGAGINVTRKIELRANYAIDLKGKYRNASTVVPAYRNQAIQISFGYKI